MSRQSGVEIYVLNEMPSIFDRSEGKIITGLHFSDDPMVKEKLTDKHMIRNAVGVDANHSDSILPLLWLTAHQTLYWLIVFDIFPLNTAALECGTEILRKTCSILSKKY